MYTYSFEKLEDWNIGKEVTKTAYPLTTKFPVSEKFKLISQIRRKSVAIFLNIAEGSAKNTAIDKAHFTTKSTE